MLKISKIITYSVLFLVALFIFDSCQKTENSTTTTITTVPFPPTDLTATVVSTTQVNLTWVDKSTNEVGFKVERKTATTNFALIATLGADITSYSDNGLTPNTAYIYRVYSYNSVGPSPTYSNEVTATTIGLPILSTNAVSNLTDISAISGGIITNDGGSVITARGVVWSTTQNPTISLITKTTDGTGSGTFISKITGLSTGTKYFIKSYATNSSGTAYGNEISIQTLSLPILTTSALSEITAITAKSGGTISSDGGSPIITRGVVWNKNINPTISLSTKSNDATGIGTFQSSILGLSSSTKYYVRAFATNAIGTAYGDEFSFTSLPFPSNLFVVKEVTSKTGRIWLDRNLGASQAAISSADQASFGDLYQWGRGPDGHQLRLSPVTNILSNTDLSGHSFFIMSINTATPMDWRSPQNQSLWQGVNGINNPCPLGYRVPTEAEWLEEISTWASIDAVGAFNSPLKLPLAGLRATHGGPPGEENKDGRYWTSTVNNTNAKLLLIRQTTLNLNIQTDRRASGLCIRCIKN